MKVEDFEFPEDRLYLKTHVWVKPHEDRFQLGITELGQSLSKEIVRINLPEVGEVIPKDDLITKIKSWKCLIYYYYFLFNFHEFIRIFDCSGLMFKCSFS
jgi:glycine cleavage system H protein